MGHMRGFKDKPFPRGAGRPKGNSEGGRRGMALQEGMHTYTPEKPCHRGHKKRYASNGECVQCAKDRAAMQRAERRKRSQELGIKRGRKPVNLPDRPKMCTGPCGKIKPPSAYSLTPRGYLMSSCNKCRYLLREFKGIDMDWGLVRKPVSVIR